jgi:hypothetical protein
MRRIFLGLIRQLCVAPAIVRGVDYPQRHDDLAQLIDS